MNTLAGKVVLLTGGSRGIGPIIANQIVERGASIALCARSKSDLEITAARLRSSNARVEIFPVDLSQENERSRLITNVLQTFGTIDVLINNAGIETEGAYIDLSQAAIRETIAVNLVAPMELTHLVLPGMLQRRYGRIVNISSIAGKSGIPYAAVYSGTKAGIAAWTRALRLELAGTGVNCSTIFPGYVRDVGLFTKFGLKPPRFIGSCTASEIAGSVVLAIEKGRLEQVINFPPAKISFLLNEIAPSLGDALLKVLGVIDFQRQKIERSRRLDHS